MSKRLPIHGQVPGTRQYQVVGHSLVDDEFFDWLNRWRWIYVNGYVGRWIRHEPGRGGRRTCLYLHRVVSGVPRGLLTDHINRDRTDNRRCNLRLVTDAKNNHNVPARGGSSKFRGVSWDKARSKWSAKVRAEGSTVHFGRFDDELEAASAAEEGRRVLLPLARGVT